MSKLIRIHFWAHWHPINLVLGIPLLIVIFLYVAPGSISSPGAIPGFRLVETLPEKPERPALKIYLPSRYAGDYDSSERRRLLSSIDIEEYVTSSSSEDRSCEAGENAPEIPSREIRESFGHLTALKPAELLGRYLWTQPFKKPPDGPYWVASYDVRNNTLMAVRLEANP